MKVFPLLLALLFGGVGTISAQTPQPEVPTAATTTVQPKIMVIPYVKAGEDLRTILENDVNKRIVLTKIREAFDSRGFTTVDFVARLKALSQSDAMKSDSQTDLKSMLVASSGADLYVEAEMDVLLTASGNAVKVLLTGYDTSSGASLSNKVGESGKFYTDDMGKLASKAVEQCATDFLNTMQAKFTDIVDNGRTIVVDFSLDEASTLTFASEIGTQGLPLSDEIMLWIESQAHKGNYHVQGTTDRQMIFDEVRVPLKDPKTGANYNVQKFGLEVFKFMRSLGLSIERNTKANTLYIKIK